MDTVTTYNGFEWRALLYEWGPRVLLAIVIMAAAWAIGWAVKWALAKVIDSTPMVSRHNQSQPQGPTVGAQLGNLANWLILLIGLISALGVLGLRYIVDPLNGLLAQVLDFLPRLIGAGLIFFIGYIVATLARRVVESALNVARVDRAIERAGVGRMTGAQGLSKTAGTVVFVLIIIPIAIAALETLGIRAISEPAIAVLRTVLDALPRVIAAAIVLAIAYFIARWVASLVEQILPSLGLDRSLSALGFGARSAEPTAGATTEAPPVAPTGMTPSKIIGQVVLWAIMLFAATQAAALLNFGQISAMLQQILTLFGRVVFGGVIILVGVLLANFLAGLAQRSSGGGGQFASTLVRWATIALVTAMGLTFMGIAPEIVTLAFGLILGSAAVAAAIAFGVGGREPAKRLLERAQQRAETAASTPATPSSATPPPPDSPLVG